MRHSQLFSSEMLLQLWHGCADVRQLDDVGLSGSARGHRAQSGSAKGGMCLAALRQEPQLCQIVARALALAQA